MKNFSYIATIAATALAITLPVTAGAQGIFQRKPSVKPDTTIESIGTPTAPATTPSSPNGYTTNFNTTTTVSPGTYPRNHSFGTFSNYGSFSRYKRSGRNSSSTFYQNHARQKMILDPNPLYPGFGRPNAASSYGNYGRSPSSTSCSTTVIGSPIPSAVPLDRSGRPCN